MIISFNTLLLFLSTAAISNGEFSESALEFLSDFGYYKRNNKDVGSMSGKIEVQNSVEKFQTFLGLPVTGVIDKATEEVMKKPRCGLKDIIDDKVPARKKRYILQGSKWNKNKITWKLLNDNNDGLSRKEVEAILDTAFSKWSNVADLTFNKLSITSAEEADIDVKFVQSNHGDNYPFLPHQRVYAHAFYPFNNKGINGDVHFNDVYNFNVKEKAGVNLLFVAIHEIGHSLGVHHSSVRKSIMFPTYDGNKDQNIELHDDDTLAIQTLYGAKSKVTPEKVPDTQNTKETHNKEAIPTSNKQFKVQAIIYEQSTGITYVFNEDKYYKLSKSLKEMHGPFNVLELFPSMAYVNGGFMNREKKLVFFQGTKYYMFESFSNSKLIDSGSIFDLFKGIKNSVEKIDGAFVGRDGTTFLLTGDEYYEYSSKQKTIESTPSKKIAAKWKVPSNIDSVFIWGNGETYFFQGLQFYRVDQHGGLLKGYPKNIDGIWMKVPKNI